VKRMSRLTVLYGLCAGGTFVTTLNTPPSGWWGWIVFAGGLAANVGVALKALYEKTEEDHHVLGDRSGS